MPRRERTAEDEQYIRELNKRDNEAQAAAKAEREAAKRAEFPHGHVPTKSKEMNDLANAQNRSEHAQDAHSEAVRNRHK